jgi:hypothetical protein
LEIHPLKETIFEKSSTDLTLWFHAIFLFSISKNGVSAKELQRQLGVTYQCAWRMAKQIRSLMDQGSDPLTGTVEVDETYVSGRRRGTAGRGAKVMTDDCGGYKYIPRINDHSKMHHGREEYVRGSVHINTIEGFWGQFKRSVRRTYVHVSKKHMQAYLNEFFSL